MIYALDHALACLAGAIHSDEVQIDKGIEISNGMLTKITPVMIG